MKATVGAHRGPFPGHQILPSYEGVEFSRERRTVVHLEVETLQDALAIAGPSRADTKKVG